MTVQPGIRFHPTDDELVSYYLKRKVMGKSFRFEVISEIELYKFAPWYLPDKSFLKSKDLEWYFFCHRDKKYTTSSKTNRATDIGYWKTTGKDRPVMHNSNAVGMKMTLIFHIGKAPRGDRTDWVMYEYRLEDKESGNTQYSQDAYVLCKIFKKSGRGPKNGEQYGAPFNEEDWEDDVASDFAVSFAHASSSRELLNDHMFELVFHQLLVCGDDETCSIPTLPDPDGILLEELAEILNSSPLHSGIGREMSHSFVSPTNGDVGDKVDKEYDKAMPSDMPGFRFHPTDAELILYYLKRKVMGKPFRFEAISEIKLYKFAPWDLPDKSFLKSKDLEWYFFFPRDRKYANSSRTNRATDIGYWKTTGKDRPIVHNSHAVGMKKSLIFHTGKAPRGDRTDWVMYEYRLEDKELGGTQYSQDTYVLCKIFQKSGFGPKNGEQYGAPFNEDDWEHNVASDFAVSFAHTSSSCELSNDHMPELVFHQPLACADGEMCSLPELPDADGFLLEELAEILNSSPRHSGIGREMSHAFVPPMNGDEFSGLDTEGNDLLHLLQMSHAFVPPMNGDEFSGLDTEGNDLEDLLGEAESRPSDSIYFSDIGDREYDFLPVISELDSEQYLELNDFHLFEKSDPPEMLVPNYLLADDVFAHHPAQADFGLIDKNYISGDNEYGFQNVISDFDGEEYPPSEAQ